MYKSLIKFYIELYKYAILTILYVNLKLFINNNLFII